MPFFLQILTESESRRAWLQRHQREQEVAATVRDSGLSGRLAALRQQYNVERHEAPEMSVGSTSPPEALRVAASPGIGPVATAAQSITQSGRGSILSRASAWRHIGTEQQPPKLDDDDVRSAVEGFYGIDIGSSSRGAP